MARWLTGHLPQKTTDRKWINNLAATALEEEGFLTMEEYIRRRQNMFTQYITTCSLLELCEESERVPGAQVEMQWWKQEGLTWRERGKRHRRRQKDMKEKS